MNKHYLLAVGSVASLIKKGEGLWAQLCYFSHEMRTNDTPCKDGEAMKASFLTEEKAASKEQKVDMGKNSTYRVIKGILVKAAEYNVELMDAKGKPRGKTNIERELADSFLRTPRLRLKSCKHPSLRQASRWTSLRTPTSLRPRLASRCCTKNSARCCWPCRKPVPKNMAEVFRLDDKVVCVVDEKEAELLRAVLGRLNSDGSGPNRAWKSHDLYLGLVHADVEDRLRFKSFHEAEEVKTT